MKQFKFDFESDRLKRGKSSYLIRFGLYFIVLIVLLILVKRQWKNQTESKKLMHEKQIRGIRLEEQPAEQKD